MKKYSTKETVLAIALSLTTIAGTLALFGSVPLLAEITQPQPAYSNRDVRPLHLGDS